MSRGVVKDAKRSCSGIGMGFGECSDYAASGSVGNEESGVQEECLGRAIRRSGTQHLIEAVRIEVKGREGIGHECSFCCTCWTDE